MIEKLNQILQGLIERYSRSGTVYNGTVVTNSVAPNTSVTINRVNLPAGTYVIAAEVQFSASNVNAGTLVTIYQNGAGTLAIERGNMSGGGGHSLCAITEAVDEAEILLNVYQTHTATVTVSPNRLIAVRIK